MAELALAYRVRSYSTGTPGRAICNARSHHFVADGSGGEEVGAGELFRSGITACAVNMVGRIASSEEIPVNWMDVSVEAYRDPERAPIADEGTVSVYDDIKVHFQIWGIDDDQGQYLVDQWKRR